MSAHENAHADAHSYAFVRKNHLRALVGLGRAVLLVLPLFQDPYP
jgi:hypothetical protein